MNQKSESEKTKKNVWVTLSIEDKSSLQDNVVIEKGLKWQWQWQWQWSYTPCKMINSKTLK
jgi:hypothetical protein